MGGMQSGMMESTAIAAQNQTVGLALYALGAIVIATAILSIRAVGRAHSEILSILMIGYGILMLLVGGWMSGGFLGMMSMPLYGYGMTVVGVLMTVNGALMRRTKMNM